MGTARPNATLLAQSFGMFCNRYPLASGYCLGEAGSSDTGVGELQRKFALMFALPNLFFFFPCETLSGNQRASCACHGIWTGPSALRALRCLSQAAAREVVGLC